MEHKRVKRDFIDRLVEEVSLSEVLRHHGVVTRKLNSLSSTCLCPFHAEKTPSFVYSDNKKMYKCFGCGASGNLITLARGLIGQESYIAVIQHLAQVAGLPMEYEDSNYSDDDLVYYDYVDSLVNTDREVISKIADIYNKQLLEPASAEAYEYLHYYRQLKPEIIQAYNLGYCPPASVLVPLLKQTTIGGGVFGMGAKNVLLSLVRTATMMPRTDAARLPDIEPEIKENQLPVHRDQLAPLTDYYETYYDRITFPIYDEVGNITGFGARTLHDYRQKLGKRFKPDQAKYKNTSNRSSLYDKSKMIYGLYQVLEHHRKLSANPLARPKIERLILVEGYLDVISLAQYGIWQGVAASGTAMKPEQIRYLFKFCKNLVLCLDGDKAGRAAALKTAKIILREYKTGYNVRILHLPGDHDPDSYLRAHSPDQFEELIQTKSKGLFEYIITSMLDEYGKDQLNEAQYLEVRGQLGELYATIDAQELNERSFFVEYCAQHLNKRAQFTVAAQQLEALFKNQEEQFKREQALQQEKEQLDRYYLEIQGAKSRFKNKLFLQQMQVREFEGLTIKETQVKHPRQQRQEERWNNSYGKGKGEQGWKGNFNPGGNRALGRASGQDASKRTSPATRGGQGLPSLGQGKNFTRYERGMKTTREQVQAEMPHSVTTPEKSHGSPDLHQGMQSHVSAEIMRDSELFSSAEPSSPDFSYSEDLAALQDYYAETGLLDAGMSHAGAEFSSRPWARLDGQDRAESRMSRPTPSASVQELYAQGALGMRGNFAAPSSAGMHSFSSASPQVAPSSPNLGNQAFASRGAVSFNATTATQVPQEASFNPGFGQVSPRDLQTTALHDSSQLARSLSSQLAGSTDNTPAQLTDVAPLGRATRDYSLLTPQVANQQPSRAQLGTTPQEILLDTNNPVPLDKRVGFAPRPRVLDQHSQAQQQEIEVARLTAPDVSSQVSYATNQGTRPRSLLGTKSKLTSQAQLNTFNPQQLRSSNKGRAAKNQITGADASAQILQRLKTGTLTGGVGLGAVTEQSNSWLDAHEILENGTDTPISHAPFSVHAPAEQGVENLTGVPASPSEYQEQGEPVMLWESSDAAGLEPDWNTPFAHQESAPEDFNVRASEEMASDSNLVQQMLLGDFEPAWQQGEPVPDNLRASEFQEGNVSLPLDGETGVASAQSSEVAPGLALEPTGPSPLPVGTDSSSRRPYADLLEPAAPQFSGNDLFARQYMQGQAQMSFGTGSFGIGKTQTQEQRVRGGQDSPAFMPASGQGSFDSHNLSPDDLSLLQDFGLGFDLRGLEDALQQAAVSLQDEELALPVNREEGFGNRKFFLYHNLEIALERTPQAKHDYNKYLNALQHIELRIPRVLAAYLANHNLVGPQIISRFKLKVFEFLKEFRVKATKVKHAANLDRARDPVNLVRELVEKYQLEQIYDVEEKIYQVNLTEREIETTYKDLIQSLLRLLEACRTYVFKYLTAHARELNNVNVEIEALNQYRILWTHCLQGVSLVKAVNSEAKDERQKERINYAQEFLQAYQNQRMHMHTYLIDDVRKANPTPVIGFDVRAYGVMPELKGKDLIYNEQEKQELEQRELQEQIAASKLAAQQEAIAAPKRNVKALGSTLSKLTQDKPQQQPVIPERLKGLRKEVNAQQASLVASRLGAMAEGKVVVVQPEQADFTGSSSAFAGLSMTGMNFRSQGQAQGEVEFTTSGAKAFHKEPPAARDSEPALDFALGMNSSDASTWQTPAPASHNPSTTQEHARGATTTSSSSPFGVSRFSDANSPFEATNLSRGFDFSKVAVAPQEISALFTPTPQETRASATGSNKATNDYDLESEAQLERVDSFSSSNHEGEDTPSLSVASSQTQEILTKPTVLPYEDALELRNRQELAGQRAQEFEEQQARELAIQEQAEIEKYNAVALAPPTKPKRGKLSPTAPSLEKLEEFASMPFMSASMFASMQSDKLKTENLQVSEDEEEEEN